MRKVAPSLIDMKKIRLKNFKRMSAIMTPFILYISYCLSGLVCFDNLLEVGIGNAIQWCLLHPFSVYNEKTLGFLLAGIVLWVICLFNFYIRTNNSYYHGAEHGVAEWGDLKKFNKIYSDKKNPHNNKILSANVRFKYAASTLRNNNTFCVGGSGAGKTSFFLTPNLINNYGCNVYTDSKGTLLEDFGNYLKYQPNTNVYQINMCEPEKSMHINPFVFIKNTFDLTKLITNFIQNTDDENTKRNASGDPFWPRAEKLFLKSIFLYVWMECPKLEMNEETGEFYTLQRNWKSVLKLLEEAHFSPDPSIPPKLDARMFSLPANHPARTTYEKYRGGADETIRSIVLTADARMEPFYTPEIIEIFCGNDIPLNQFGVGVDGDQVTKSNLFIVIPDDDDTFNFVPGIIYTLLFQELYYQARFFHGRLPMDVGIWLDEFANIKMPNNFDKILATCRSRGIYCTMFLQSLAQMKTLFVEGAWEGLVGNCDTFLYLGGNEQSTFKYISELLGEWTMDKRTTGESRGSNGSLSENRDVVGRKLMDEFELRLLPNDECIIFIRGEKALRDKKWFPWEHKEYEDALKYGTYNYEESLKEEIEDNGFNFINETSLSYLKKQAEKDKNIKITTIDPFDFMFMDIDALMSSDNTTEQVPDFNLDKLQEMFETEQTRKEMEEMEKFLEHYDEMKLYEIYASNQLNSFRKRIIREMNKKNVKEEYIKSIVHPLLSDEEVAEKKAAYYDMCGYDLQNA